MNDAMLENLRDARPATMTPPTSDSVERDYELSIVMPCLNEAETLETCIRKAQAWLPEGGRVGEVVIADNGSSGGSVQSAERCAALVTHVPMGGDGAAPYFGSPRAPGPFIVIGDSPGSF